MCKPIEWDKRDYELQSELQQLPSYGLLPNGDRMVSLKEAIRSLDNQAEGRGKR